MRALLSPPDPRAVLRTVELPIALLGALLAHPALLYVDDAVRQTQRVRGGWAAVALCTALISLLHFRLCAPGRTAGAVFVRSAGFGLVLGPLNSGFSLATVTALEEGLEPSVLGVFVLGTLFGCIAGASIGLLFGVLYSPLTIVGSQHRELPTHTGQEKARALAGAMLVVASIVHHACLPGDIALQLVGGLVGGGLVAVGLCRLLRLELFLRAVKRGDDPTWSLIEARDPSDAAGLLSIHGAGEAEKILYRATIDDRATPYRAQSQWHPVARLAA
jgi:hypothetical protein